MRRPAQETAGSPEVKVARRPTVSSPPWITLLVASVGRYHELEALLISLAGQTYRRFDVVLVDQNEDERLRPLVNCFRHHFTIEWIRSEPGLSRARNLGLQYCRGEIIGFPDDDCVYPPSLLTSVAYALQDDAEAAGISILPRDHEGRPFPRYGRNRGVLTQRNILRRCTSISLFLRRSVVAATGQFNERLGLGAGTIWGAGEDVDFPLRVIQAGHRIDFRPDLHVVHRFDIEDATPAAAARRGFGYGAGLGWVLRRHRFPLHVVVKFVLLLPIAGMTANAARGRWTAASFYAGALHGRLRGWLSA